MWSLKKIKFLLGYVLYHGIAMHLPSSYSHIKVGQTQFRRFCARWMLEECGKNVNVEKGARFSGQMSLGDYSGLGINSKIGGGTSIGKYVMMGENCTIITRNHNFARTDIPMMCQGVSPEMPVTIGDDVWIGDRVMIMPGVSIGEGCIIGAGAIVTHDIPSYSIAAGVPAKVIKSRKV